MKHVIAIFFDEEREHYQVSDAWVKDRMQLFYNFTMQSLREQSFADFEIWMLCGKRFKAYTTKAFKKLAKYYDSRVKWSYYRGSDLIFDIKDDHLCISRIDSDDLYAKDALEVINQEAEKIKSNEIEYMAFRNSYLWDRNNGYIGFHRHISPPFISQIYPKSLYQNYGNGLGNFFVEHGSMGGRLPQCVGLPDNKICVVKHEANVSDAQRRREPRKIGKAAINKMALKGEAFTDKSVMRTILKDFGVPRERV